MGVEIYCTQLGMMLDIAYCLSMNDGLPCRNAVGCWQERTDIAALLRAKFSDEELRKAFGGPSKSKLTRIVESIESARKKE